MTTNNHTPGPWRTATDSFGTFVETTGASIAKIGSPDDEINQANARLIAAAPCLLKALQDLMEVTEYGDGNFEQYNAAEAAITKATTPSS